MNVLIDLHVHTRLGSADSFLDPAGLAQLAVARGIAGMVAAEHYRVWTDAEVAAFSTQAFRVFPGAEVITDAGHILVIGMERYPTSRTLSSLTAEAAEANAALVLAHPFRGKLDHWQRASRNDLLNRDSPSPPVHAIEVANGGCTDHENQLAMALALRSPGVSVAGSDAHTGTHVGRWATAFASLPRDSRELAAWLIAGEGVSGIRQPGHTGSELAS